RASRCRSESSVGARLASPVWRWAPPRDGLGLPSPYRCPGVGRADTSRRRIGGTMSDSLRGAAAIVGIGELKPERTRPNRDAMSLLAEAAYIAIQDAGLTKADIDGMI